MSTQKKRKAPDGEPDVSIFTPFRRQLPESCDFVLLTDSLAYTKGARRTRNYMVELLEHLEQKCHWFGVAVMAHGASFTWGRDSGYPTYSDMIEKAPKAHLVLLETAGNDFWSDSMTIGGYRNDLDMAVKHWISLARQVSRVQMTVCGACAAVWRYKSSEGSLFDENIARLQHVFEAEQVHTISGASELLGIQIADSCGHIAPAGKSQVFNAWVKWIEMGMRLRPEDFPATHPPATTLQNNSKSMGTLQNHSKSIGDVEHQCLRDSSGSAAPSCAPSSIGPPGVFAGAVLGNSSGSAGLSSAPSSVGVFTGAVVSSSASSSSGMKWVPDLSQSSDGKPPPAYSKHDDMTHAHAPPGVWLNSNSNSYSNSNSNSNSHSNSSDGKPPQQFQSDEAPPGVWSQYSTVSDEAQHASKKRAKAKGLCVHVGAATVDIIGTSVVPKPPRMAKAKGHCVKVGDGTTTPSVVPKAKAKAKGHRVYEQEADGDEVVQPESESAIQFDDDDGFDHVPNSALEEFLAEKLGHLVEPDAALESLEAKADVDTGLETKEEDVESPPQTSPDMESCLTP